MKTFGLGVLIVLAACVPRCAGQVLAPANAKSAAPAVTPAQQALVVRVNQLVKQMDDLTKAQTFKEGVPVAEECLTLCRQLFGERSPNTAFAFNQLGYFHLNSGNMAEAKEFSEQGLKIRREVLGDKHPFTALTMLNLADALYGLGEYDRALELFQECLAINRLAGEKSQAVADLMHRVGDSRLQKKDFAAALPNFQSSLAIRKELLGDRHPDVGRSQHSIGVVLLEMGQHAQARACFEQAVAIHLATAGQKAPSTVAALHGLGMACRSLNDFVIAKICFQRVLAVRKEILSPQDPAIFELYALLGEATWREGDVAGARSLFMHAAKGYRQALGEDGSMTINMLVEIGNLDASLGNDASARAIFEKTLALISKKTSAQDPATLVVRIPLATLASGLGHVEEAQAQFREALAIARKSLPEEHADTGYLYHELGGFLSSTGRKAEAQKYLERALAIRKKVLGETHHRTANTLDALAVVCAERHDYLTAKAYCAQSLKIRRATLSNKHPDVARPWNNLGYLEASSGNVAKAIEYTGHALEIQRGLPGMDDANLAVTLSNLAMFSTLGGDLQAAARYADQSRRKARSHVVGALSTLPEAEQLAYLARNDLYLSFVAYSVAAQGRRDPQIAALSAGWLLNAKGLAQEVLAERSVLARESHDPKTRELAQRLVAVRARQARAQLAVAGNETGQKLGDERARLAQEEEALSRELSRAGARAPRTRPWVELSDIRGKLAPQEVLIDMARFRWFDFAKSLDGEKGADHYFAWIIPPSGDVRMVDLGDAQQIDAAVIAMRVALKNVFVATDSPGKLKLDPAAFQVFNGALIQLSQLILHPLVKQLGSATEISLSPDVGLWLVPWNALLLEDGRFAIEQYPIRYLSSCRELVAPASPVTPRRPLIVASPNFDLDPEAARRLTVQLLGGKQSAEAPAAKVLSTGSTSTTIATPLPQFAKLPELVSADLTKFTGKKPGVFVGSNALEGIVKAVHHPRIALFATHGYFEPTLGMSDDERAALAAQIAMSSQAPQRRAVNPLLLCGVLLAGCNRADHSQGEDGILTGMEIVGIDWRGTELVVLSACDTGVGEVRISEGVAGVRQAFQLGGAEAVVSTLWPVIVEESTLQVSSFFSKLAAGQTKAQALRGAQLESIKRLKKKYGGAPPLHWAAFTVTGK